MAGAGFKDFQAGAKLTAEQVDTYLMQQSVMRFASSAARGSAIGTAVAEGMVSYLDDSNSIEVYNGSSWVGLESTLNDGTAGYTALSNGTAGITYQPVSHNYIINGAFDVWQRGTSDALGINNYIADRWGMNRGSYAAGATASKQATSDTTNLPNIESCIRVQRDSGNSATDSIAIWQSLENVNSKPLIGQSVTLSFWARKGANFSQASSNLNCQIQQSTGTDENINTKTGGSNIISQQNLLTTTWQRFTATGTANSASTQLHVVFQYVPTGTAGADDWFEITGVQLEAGSVATPFKRHAPSLQGELAACERYYQTSLGTSSSHGLSTTQTLISHSVSFSSGFTFRTTMRAAPSVLIYSRSGNVNKVSLVSSGADVGGDTTAANISASQVWGLSNSTNSFTANAGIEASWTANAEL